MSSKISELTLTPTLRPFDQIALARAGANFRAPVSVGRFRAAVIDHFIPGQWIAEPDTTDSGYISQTSYPEYWPACLGIIHCTTEGSSGGYGGMRMPVDVGTGAGCMSSLTRVKLDDLPTSGQDYVFAVGGRPNGANSWSGYAAALWCSSASAYWQLSIANNGAPSSSVDTGISVTAGVWLDVEAWVDWDNLTAGGFVNGVATAGLTGIANITAPSGRYRPAAGIRKLAGTTDRRATLDLLGFAL